VRPDVWTHLLFGRGFGSYNHDTYRILDSEILGRTVETGVLGVLAFVLISVAVVFTARRTIASRVSPYAGLALIGTAAAVCFLTVSTLFDVLGFPHITYIFLCLAGFVAAVADPPTARHAPRTRRDHAYRRHWARQKSRTLGGVH
jgi:O-antigen ligase